jgi:indole-3-glycerol phosphate synthase
MILDDILARTRIDVAERKRAVPIEQVAAAAAAMPPARGFAAALRRGRDAAGIATISEFKRRSPSAGWIGKGAEADLPATVKAYAEGGASALSVLTDGPFFGGALPDLATARAACALPALRKDFIVDSYQVVEARAAGADAILLIVAALSDPELAGLHAAARELGLDVLVEAHDASEVTRAVAIGAEVVGVNNRDLRTFTVDRELVIRLRTGVPPSRLLVAESGIRDAGDVARLRAAGIDAMLVGETLMRAPDPAAALRALYAR